MPTVKTDSHLELTAGLCFGLVKGRQPTIQMSLVSLVQSRAAHMPERVKFSVVLVNGAVLRRTLAALVLFVGAHADGQSTNPNFPNPGKTSIARENQHALALQAAAQVYQQMSVLADTSPETDRASQAS